MNFIERLVRNAHDFSELLDTNPNAPALREEFKKADLVIGWDPIKKAHALFYGRAVLNEFRKGRSTEWDGLRCLAIRYNNDSRELEFLVAACLVLKGSCDYIADYGEAP